MAATVGSTLAPHIQLGCSGASLVGKGLLNSEQTAQRGGGITKPGDVQEKSGHVTRCYCPTHKEVAGQRLDLMISEVFSKGYDTSPKEGYVAALMEILPCFLVPIGSVTSEFDDCKVSQHRHGILDYESSLNVVGPHIISITIASSWC
ncbi:hypothetical protein TURU_066442 [Turdus rufiventris]|nr:hypothetical protein TURU_066442 [Turdus rufiventris]